MIETIIKQKFPDIVSFHLEHITQQVTAAETNLEFLNDKYILLNKTLDIPVYSKLRIISADNLFVTSKAAFENYEHNRYQVFSEFMEITLSQYGASDSDIVPFELEFFRVVPYKKDDEPENKQVQNFIKKGISYFNLFFGKTETKLLKEEPKKEEPIKKQEKELRHEPARKSPDEII